jgi:DNA-binding response OmpR family regulator
MIEARMESDRVPVADSAGGAGHDSHEPRSRPHDRSPWVGIDTNVDPVRWARLLRRAHQLALTKGVAPSMLRELVARSWKRAASAGVDPDRPAPRMLTRDETSRSLAHHPVSHLLPLVESMLAEATEDARYFAVLSDAEGVLLWAGGHPRALEIAVGPAFLPGHLASESAVGTNAIGTAIALDHPVQIFSAEHFSRLLHGWTCSAAPIHDPESEEILGVLDLSGEFRTGHPHSLSLVSAVARVIEDKLAEEQARRDEHLRELYLERIAVWSRQHSALVSRNGRVLAASPRGWIGRHVELPEAGESMTLANGSIVTSEPIGSSGARILTPAPHRRRSTRRPRLRLETLGRRRAQVTLNGERTKLTPRHSEIILLLALNPDGLSSLELGRELYGPDFNPITVRAEMSRLRRLLGPLLATGPYRLDAEVHSDFGDVERLLEQGEREAVRDRYRGALLTASEVPAIAAARDRLDTAVHAGGTSS